jgi:hypothetical protein
MCSAHRRDGGEPATAKSLPQVPAGEASGRALGTGQAAPATGVVGQLLCQALTIPGRRAALSTGPKPSWSSSAWAPMPDAPFAILSQSHLRSKASQLGLCSHMSSWSPPLPGRAHSRTLDS